MTKKTLDKILNDMPHDTIIKTISKIFALASGFLLAVFGAYIYSFNSSTIHPDAAVWGQFGDYIGGVLNPILSFLTLGALILTIVIQNRQLLVSSNELELSRKELELTREELHRSATAQELSEKSLKAQVEVSLKSSRLNTINFLLDYYEVQIKSLSHIAYTADDPRSHAFNDLLNRKAHLTNMLNSVYDDLIYSKDITNE
jgi:hypothetical protein